MQRKFRLLREEAYKDGVETFPVLALDPTFRDFVCMYIGEGYKRSRNSVGISNADPRVIVLATRWLRVFSRNKLVFSVQHHSDQDPRMLPSSGGPRLESPRTKSERCRRPTAADFEAE
jgi:hypothetical protein